MNDPLPLLGTRHLPVLHPASPSRAVGIDKARGIYESGFEPKELGTHAINAALNCGVKCVYCSSDAVLSQLESYRTHVRNWWSADAVVYYKNIVANVRRDAERMCDRKDVEVVFSSTVDAFQKPLVLLDIPHDILAALAPTKMRLRLLSKLTAAGSELSFIADHFGERATIGTSIPILDAKLARIIEPFAPPPANRARRILGRAKELGLRRYVMACPILPGLYANYNAFANDWARVVDAYAPEKIWFEPLNARGRNIEQLKAVLQDSKMLHLADKVQGIRTNVGWTDYNAELLDWVQRFTRAHYDVKRTKYLLYPHALTVGGKAALKKNDACVIWL